MTHKLALDIYEFLKSNLKNLPPFSFQIIEQDGENNSILFIKEPTSAFEKYFGDFAQRVRFRIVLVNNKLAHREQLETLQGVINTLCDYWESPNFKVLQKQINNIFIFKETKHNNWVQIDPVRFSLEAQEYYVDLDLLYTQKGGDNV
ncbi:Hypothetical protein MBVG_6970 [Mycoplasmopsis bovigenitalium 51080]|uniref:Uncharacterized protein n=1 Tax=Mycoplasmopsis bovigenitalium 51080 TaxID=1188235 RepID=N9VBE8_9BACT|nr:hypothetical protein [Mycoplasmopsis bovigenitalium]ENY69018.1 Hypothetical protein MBVG_6970 [Mycoplasmopsis bovigenitalium 51080]